ncbi:scopoletin glucosyltransferase-like [Punica granatum]|uniref:Uncharacterized protein n=2 Tax=Punica granatum TaxID=22663 RepID=A0A2I0HP84_PUNGR|nr:scopoletin glucosyltransferase-like [Punica granatum]PKI33539.1 hypothetical protein CRG98_046095 [Punica granatum]
MDMAKLFAAQGMRSTVFTTPLNAAYFPRTVERSRFWGIEIEIQTVKFPSLELGLPEGCENFDFLTSRKTAPEEVVSNFFDALGMLRDPMSKLLEEFQPNCLVADIFFPWTVDIAPSSEFLGFYFTAPAASPCVLLNSSDLIIHTRRFLPIPRPSPFLNFLAHPANKATTANTKEKGERGKEASVTVDQWLDARRPNSIVYVCFGSVSKFSPSRHLEIAEGLEASEQQFIWVVRKADDEGVTAGVPLVTWPVSAEQFYNEKLVTQDDVEKAVRRAMVGGEAEEMRSRARELSNMARPSKKAARHLRIWMS